MVLNYRQTSSTISSAARPIGQATLAQLIQSQTPEKGEKKILSCSAVVLPATSRASVLSRILWLTPAISMMPPALSLMGPYASIERPVAIVLSMPRAGTTMPYMEAVVKLM
nr:unnamed protein product [Digitaria exilis]